MFSSTARGGTVNRNRSHVRHQLLNISVVLDQFHDSMRRMPLSTRVMIEERTAYYNAMKDGIQEELNALQDSINNDDEFVGITQGLADKLVLIVREFGDQLYAYDSGTPAQPQNLMVN
jgi:hypothetical protein